MNTTRNIAIYFALSLPQETALALGEIDNRFPTLFELRRAQWPRVEHLADTSRYDPGIAGFLEHVLLGNYRECADWMRSTTGDTFRLLHRQAVDGGSSDLSEALAPPI